VAAEAKIKITSQDLTSTGIKSAESGIGKLTKAIRSYGAEIGAVIGAVYGAVKVIKNLTDAYAKQEEAVARLESSMVATGAYTPQLSQEIQTLASQLQKTTIYGDEATLSAAGLLQSLGKLSGEGLKEAIPLVQDFAAGMGIDLNTAASLIGKTLGSSTNALSRYGIVIDATAPKSEKLAALTREIERSFGGMSEAMGETFKGRMTRMKNLIGDIKEILGKLLIGEAATFMTWLLDFLQQGNNIQIIAKVFKGLLATIATVIGFTIELFKTWVKEAILVGKAFQNLGKIIAAAFNPKKWGSGEAKAAWQELKRASTEISKDIAEDWVKYAQKTYGRWENVFKDVDTTISTVSNNVKYNIEKIGDAAEETNKEIEELLKKGEQFRDSMVLTGIQLEIYLEQLKSRRESEAWLKEDIEETNEEMERMVDNYMYLGEAMSAQTQAFADMNNESYETSEKINYLSESLRELEITQKELAEFTATTFRDSMIDSFDAVMSGAKSLKEGLKDMIAGFLQALGKMFFTQFLANLAIPFGKTRAMKFLAASVAAYAGAAVVRSLAQGGEFETRGPQLMMVGDNPSGRERVRVEPIERSQSRYSGPMQGDVYFDGTKVGRWFSREIASKNIPIYSGAITNNR